MKKQISFWFLPVVLTLFISELVAQEEIVPGVKVVSTDVWDRPGYESNAISNLKLAVFDKDLQVVSYRRDGATVLELIEKNVLRKSVSIKQCVIGKIAFNERREVIILGTNGVLYSWNVQGNPLQKKANALPEDYYLLLDRRLKEFWSGSITANYYDPRYRFDKSLHAYYYQFYFKGNSSRTIFQVMDHCTRVYDDSLMLQDVLPTKWIDGAINKVMHLDADKRFVIFTTSNPEAPDRLMYYDFSSGDTIPVEADLSYRLKKLLRRRTPLNTPAVESPFLSEFATAYGDDLIWNVYRTGDDLVLRNLKVQR